MPKGVLYKINGITVTAPDTEAWTPFVAGESLAGLQKRSPYWELTWSLGLGDNCDLDWLAYDNMELDSLTTRAKGKLDEYETYIDAKCVVVTLRYSRGVAEEMTAKFRVDPSQIV